MAAVQLRLSSDSPQGYRTGSAGDFNVLTTFEGAGFQNSGSGGIHVGGNVHINNSNKDDAKDFLSNLIITDPSEDRNALQRKKGRRAANTCEWILDTEPLIAWLGNDVEPDDQSSNILWLYGNPGTGKSTMAIFLTEELTKTFTLSSGKTLAYFFCDSSFDTRKTATAVVRGLLLQLVQQRPQLLDHILPKYRERGAKLFESFDAVWLLFEDIVTKAPGQLFCIIDALDECDTESQSILLKQLESLQYSSVAMNLKVLITSRPYSEIREALEHFASLADLAAFPESKDDIRRCIDDKVTILQKRKKYTSKVTTQVKQVLEDKAQGTFLWVGLACEELTNIPSKDAVKFLQELPPGLYAVYKSLLNGAIRRQGADKDAIKRILSFVTVAQRPLNIAELSEACKLHLDTDDIETRLQFTRDEIASCRLMVIIQDDEVLLLHQSVKDFLVGTGADHFLDELQAHADAAYRCIDQLVWHFKQKEKHEAVDIAFLPYSIDFWPDHARIAQTRFKVRESDEEFFAMDSPIRERWLEFLRAWALEWERPPSQFSILHIAARWGLPVLLDYTRSTNFLSTTKTGAIDFDCVDSAGRTPLEEAARKGHISVINQLLIENVVLTKRVVEITARNDENGEAVMKLLLDHRGDQISITDGVIQTAAENSRSGEKVVIVLLGQQRATIMITEASIPIIARYFSEAVMELLLDRWGEQITITKAIVQAASKNEESGEAVARVLLSQQREPITVMEEAIPDIARCFSPAVMELLLNRRGEQTMITETVVQAARENKESGEAIMRVLLGRHREPIVIQESAIPIIARCFSGAVMELLLDWQKDRIKITEAVVQAARENEENGEAVMKVLLDPQKDPIAITEAAVIITASYFSEAIIELLLDRQDQIMITEAIVQAAAGNSQNGEFVVRLLLDRRGDQITITEGVVQAAVRNYNNGEAVMKVLLGKRGNQIRITDEILQAAAGNIWSGDAVMRLLLDRWKDEVVITESVVQAAVGNSWKGVEIMNLLLDRREQQIIITEAIVQTAARNYMNGEAVVKALLSHHRSETMIMDAAIPAIIEAFSEAIIRLLLDQRNGQIAITEAVISAAAQNQESGASVTALLLTQMECQITITEAIVQAAAENEKSGEAVMRVLLDRQRNPLEITEAAILIIIEHFSETIIKRLLDRQGPQICVTEVMVQSTEGNLPSDEEDKGLPLDLWVEQIHVTEMIMKAAASSLRRGVAVMRLLLDRLGDDVVIPESVVEAAVENPSSGKAIMKLLLERRGDHISITEAVVQAAIENEKSGEAVMELLFDERGDDITITEAVIQAAIENENSGETIIKMFLDRQKDPVTITDQNAAIIATHFSETIMDRLIDRLGNQFKITEAVVQAVAHNYQSGEAVMKVLLDRGGNDVVITEPVVQAALDNFWSGEAIIRLLLDRREGQTQPIIKAITETSGGEASINWLISRRMNDIISDFPKVMDEHMPPSDEEKEILLRQYRESLMRSNDPNMQLSWAREALDHVEILAGAASREHEVCVESIDQEAGKPPTPCSNHEFLTDATTIVNDLANQGHPEAIFIRSKWLEFGKFGKKQDKKEAYNGYVNAAKKGWARAEYRIGLLYEQSGSIGKALQHYDTGLELKDSAASYRLGMIKLTGQYGQRKDIQGGLDLIHQAADSADEDAPHGAFIYGMLIARDLPDVVVPEDMLALDNDIARQYIEKAAYLGFAKAQQKMGEAYELCQLGCDFNPAASVHYYRLAAVQGQPEACLGVSRWFLFGHEGIFARNEHLAYKYAQLAAASKLSTGEFAMGYYSEIGIHVDKDIEEARRWYKLAAEHGNKDAADRLKGLLEPYKSGQGRAYPSTTESKTDLQEPSTAATDSVQSETTSTGTTSKWKKWRLRISPRSR